MICCIVIFLYLQGSFSFFCFEEFRSPCWMQRCLRLFEFDMLRPPVTLRDYQPGAYVLCAQVIDKSTANIFIKPAGIISFAMSEYISVYLKWGHPCAMYTLFHSQFECQITNIFSILLYSSRGLPSIFQIYEYDTVIKDAVDIHYPVNEMVCNSKIRQVLVCLLSRIPSKSRRS